MRRVAHLDQIESVVQGGPATSDLDEVSASWRRCTAELLINPEGRAAPHFVTESELRVYFRLPRSRAGIFPSPSKIWASKCRLILGHCVRFGQKTTPAHSPES